MKRITLQDIAREAGVHITTVSMALRHHPRISAKTRKRIHTIARRLGYSPDPVLSALNAYRISKSDRVYQATLAWINDGPRKPHNTEPWWYVDYFIDAQSRARELGYELEEFCIPELHMDGTALSRVLSSRNIPGVIIAPLPEGKQHTLDLVWERFSALAIGYSLTHPRLHVVTNHQYRTIQDAIRKLRSLGHKRLGFVCSNDHDRRVNHAYLAMYWVDYHNQPASCRVPPFMFDGDLPTVRQLRTWYQRHKPEAILCNDQKVTGLFQDMGLKPGRDIDIASIRAASRPGEDRHAGMDQNGKVIGSIAVDVLVGMIQRNERGVPAVPHVTMVESNWIAGTTVREG